MVRPVAFPFVFSQLVVFLLYTGFFFFISHFLVRSFAGGLADEQLPVDWGSIEPGTFIRHRSAKSEEESRVSVASLFVSPLFFLFCSLDYALESSSSSLSGVFSTHVAARRTTM